MTKKEKMKVAKAEAGEGGGRGEKADDGFPQEIVGDARFSRIHNDPRFQRLPKHKTKVPIDSRFAHMFHDRGFAEKEVDKRGGSKRSNKQEEFLRRYYKYDEEDAEEAEQDTDSDDQVGKILLVRREKRKSKDSGKRKKKIVQPESGSDGEVDDKSDEDEAETALPSKAKVGEVLASEEASDFEKGADSDEEVEGSGLDEDGEDEEESSSSSSSSSSAESESEDEESKSEEKVPTTDHETKRLALMNMDWDNIRAVDLLVVLRSFQPKGGTVESVTIYPSEFGIEQMAKEAVQGPQGIFTHDDGESEDEADPEKLREYEKARLRYYYAVAACDSVATASCVYSSCDGLEYEKTSNTLDLRFIPDDMKFAREPKDSATDIPNDYKPVEFETKALQHSNVKLTWDDDEPIRAKALRRKFSADQLNEQDYRDYIASSSSESESGSKSEEDEGSDDEEKAVGEEKQKLREKYLSLLSDTGAEEGNVVGRKVEKGNIEIKFNTGLDELSEKLTEKINKTETDETVWEAYLRKKKEKKKVRKNKSKDDESDFSEDDDEMSVGAGAHTKDDPFFNHDEDPFDDPFFQEDGTVPTEGKGKKTKERKGSTKIGMKFASSVEEKKKKKEEAAQEKKEDERRKVELELLLMDDDMVQNGEAVTKSQKDSNKKDSKAKKEKKKGKKKAEGMREKLAATASYEDPRFASLFTSHHFAIDPTDPQFKKSAAQLSTIAEKQRQRLEPGKTSKENQDDVENGSGRKRKAELSSLVRSLKSKVQARK